MVVVAAAAVATAAGMVAVGMVAVGMIAVGIAAAAWAYRSLVAVILPSPSRPSHRAAAVAVKQIIAQWMLQIRTEEQELVSGKGQVMFPSQRNR